MINLESAVALVEKILSRIVSVFSVTPESFEKNDLSVMIAAVVGILLVIGVELMFIPSRKLGGGHFGKRVVNDFKFLVNLLMIALVLLDVPAAFGDYALLGCFAVLLICLAVFVIEIANVIAKIFSVRAIVIKSDVVSFLYFVTSAIASIATIYLVCVQLLGVYYI